MRDGEEVPCSSLVMQRQLGVELEAVHATAA
jgi:hypothetical protein